jgi:dolichol kinase
VTHALALDSQVLAQDLYAFLREIDPARWRDDLETATRQRLTELRDRARALQARHAVVSGTEGADTGSRAALYGRVTDLVLLLEDAVPARGLPVERMRAAWNDFRLEAVTAYEQLAAALKPMDVHVPSLRPTNYFRNVYHVASGVTVMVLVQHLLPENWLLPVAAAFALAAWTFEVTRRIWPAINRSLMWVFSKVAHPHEAFRINSATWFTSALVLLAMTGDRLLISVALAVLAVGDPAAALVGRRYGSIKLVNGRSLQGTLAFVAVGTLAALATLRLYYPDVGLALALLLAAAGATAGALAELFARRIDDNLAIPTTVAASVGLLAMALGL